MNGIFATAATTRVDLGHDAARPVAAEIRSTIAWPKPVDPLGFGAATTQPCAAHSDGFQRVDQASPHAPCGPPWIRNTTGYFLDGSKFGGLISQVLDLAAGGVDRQALGLA